MDFPKTNLPWLWDSTLFLTRHGSHAYGTNVASHSQKPAWRVQDVTGSTNGCYGPDPQEHGVELGKTLEAKVVEGASFKPQVRLILFLPQTLTSRDAWWTATMGSNQGNPDVPKVFFSARGW